MRGLGQLNYYGESYRQFLKEFGKKSTPKEYGLYLSKRKRKKKLRNK